MGVRTLRVFHTHTEAYKQANRLEQARLIVRRIERQGREPWLFGGDLNAVPPEATLRAHFPDEPETDMSTDLTIALFRKIEGCGEILERPEGNPIVEQRTFTFPASDPNRRLDYLFHSQNLTLEQGRVMEEVAGEEALSDHLPILGVFTL